MTFVVRDDGAVGSGRSAAYCVSVPPGTALLRATLTWMDLPGAALINRLHLKITRQCGVPRQCQAEPSSGTAPAPDPVYQGNTWQPPPNDRLSRLVPHGAPFQSVHTTEQIVIENPPPGRYGVVVTAELFPGVVFNPAHVQPFALVV